MIKKIPWIGFSLFTILLLSYQNCSMVAPPDSSLDMSSLNNMQVNELESAAFRVIRNNCVECHNPDRAEGGVDYITRLDLLYFYRMVVPGEPQLSTLYNVIQSGEMPPPPYPPLNVKDATAIHDWILLGFPSGSASIPPPPISPTLEPKFSNIRQNIFQQRCAGCHSGNNPSGGFNVLNYDAVRARALSGRLIQRMTTTAPIMPPGSPLSSLQIGTIQTWIQNGALNN